MKEKKVDRRIKYTTYLLRKSLVELMQTTSITKISVKRLCEEADINRSTFYAHYSDPYDLLKKLEQEVIAELKIYITEHTQITKENSAMQVMTKVLEYAAKNADLFTVLLGKNSNLEFKKDVMVLVQEATISELRENPSIDERTSEYLQCFVITSTVEIISKWLQEGMIEPAEEMADMVTKLLFNGISQYVEKPIPKERA